MYDSRHRTYRILAKLTCRNAIDWNEETRVRQFQTFFLSTLQCIACSLVYGGILSHFLCSNFELWMTIWNDHLSPDDTLNKLEFSFGELLDDRPRKKLISVSFSLPLITLLSFTSCPSRLTPHSNSFYFFFWQGKFSTVLSVFRRRRSVAERESRQHTLHEIIHHHRAHLIYKHWRKQFFSSSSSCREVQSSCLHLTTTSARERYFQSFVYIFSSFGYYIMCRAALHVDARR